MRRLVYALAIAPLLAVHEPPARACGCLSPPAPAVVPGDFAINQSAEQIIFETTPGWVTAHVLIRYSGDPSQFAWIVPVPEVPTELAISPVSAFGLLDQATQPQLSVFTQDACPQSSWICHYDDPKPSFGCAGAEENAAPVAFADAGVGVSDAGGGTPPVQVINTQTVGDYQTVTFRASEASAATQWLHDNGFIVNDTTSIFMDSYIQQNMVFLAAKLLPGAGVSAIKPLKMTYRAAYPMVPLVLTAVAAQPNLTVTAFVYGTDPFRPMGHPVVTIDGGRLATDPAGRLNYPMVLARTIDEAGGDAFAIEYRGYSSPSTVGNGSCCTDDNFCNLGGDGACECPGEPWDANDCEGDGDLGDGVTLLKQLGQTYPSLTRITTRISPEEMTFDPQFEPDPGALPTGNLQVQGTQISVASCASRVIEHQTLADTTAREGCTAMYCGPHGQCVTTPSGPACACDAGFVAQQFTDLDDHPSVTCVPATPPCDLRAGGDVLPDACAAGAGVDCGAGQCIDRNGIAVCACNGGAAATLGATAPHCDTIAIQTMTPGAQNYSSALAGIHVCAPAPPDCDGAKLEHVDVDNPGVDCGDATPPASMQYPTPGGGCQQSRGTQGVTFMGMMFGALLVIVRRRRR